jgi:hypothetical protein
MIDVVLNPKHASLVKIMTIIQADFTHETTKINRLKSSVVINRQEQQ